MKFVAGIVARRTRQHNRELTQRSRLAAAAPLWQLTNRLVDPEVIAYDLSSLAIT
jgi:hypothetical protein